MNEGTLPVEMNSNDDQMNLKFDLIQLIKEGYNQACSPESGKTWDELSSMERKHFIIIGTGCLDFLVAAMNDEDSPFDTVGTLTVKDVSR